jgi:D-serine deaminase-like pyridoxal phosphate-dependent protein
LATVISTPTPARAVVDAGSKVLTSDLLGFPDFGHVLGHPETSIVGLSEEHGILKVDPDNQLKDRRKDQDCSETTYVWSLTCSMTCGLKTKIKA